MSPVSPITQVYVHRPNIISKWRTSPPIARLKHLPIALKNSPPLVTLLNRNIILLPAGTQGTLAYGSYKGGALNFTSWAADEGNEGCHKGEAGSGRYNVVHCRDIDSMV